ncbi:DgyrCDS9901 [Dimorphilus gyrociliatus]|uniref:DgyrCDS9901 n=1 Tax=Dimorphilus gyrociliatus TaxID=2664684 RepID=A0A7I8W137_9ANNE|nr:DgyrCDS9901 [Dimorphilus gyrociliatus]
MEMIRLLIIQLFFFSTTFGADPTFTNIPATGYLAENAKGTPTPITIFTITANDVDGDTLFFAFDTPLVPNFNVDISTGVVTYTGAGISAAATATVTLNILLFDSGGGTAGPVSLEVDIDESPRSQSDPTNAYPTYIANVKENTDPIYVIKKFDIEDPEGLTMIFSEFWVPSQPTWISFDTASQEMRFIGPTINFEATANKGPFSATLLAQDPGGHMFVFSFTVTIVDDNDPPVFTNLPDSIFLAENHATAQNLFTVMASDEDGDAVIFSMTSSPTNAALSIHPTTGVISVSSSPGFDYDVTKLYNLTIDVSDGTNTTKGIYSVYITEVQVPPTIDNLPGSSLSVPEDAATNTVLYTLTASDGNLGDTLTFSIVGGTPFTIDPSSGQIKVNAPLDFETQINYNIQVSISDGSVSVGPSIIGITVTNVNEKPIITNLPANATVNDDETLTRILLTVTVTEPEGNSLTYSIVSNPPSAPFQINPSGQVSLNANPSLDGVTTPVYQLNVTASDGVLADVQTFTIYIINDAPLFTNLPTVVSVDESRTASLNLHTVACTDPEGDVITYGLASVQPTSVAFSINPTSGVIILASNPNLDYETVSEYYLNVSASDGSLISYALLQVNVTDVNETPSINNLPTSLTISEFSQATALIQVDVQEPDNDAITFTLSSIVPANGAFSVNASGYILLSTPTNLNYESVKQYIITIEASDGTLTDSKQLTINVTDEQETPNINNLPSTVVVYENHTGPADLLTVLASDEDTGDSITFSLNWTQPSAGPFTITGSGIVKLNSNPNLDYETVKRYALEIVATDTTSLRQSKILYVNISDVNESPLLLNLPKTLIIYENYTSNTIYSVSASDEEGDALYFTLEKQSVMGFFLIDSNTGSIKLAPGSTLDYETTTEYWLTISVNDTVLQASANLTIQILNVNEKPVYTGTTQQCSIKENTLGFLLQLNASDPESDPLSYTIISVFPNTSSFTVDSSGTLKTTAAFDFEQQALYIVEINIKDSEDNYVTLNVTVNIEDTNERPVLTNAPTILNVSENTPNGIVLYTLMSTDDDGDAVTYGLIDNFHSFNVSADGKLVTIKSPNYEERVQYVLEVYVSDGTLNYTSTVTINVIDINEAPVLVTSLPLSIAVNENFIGQIISVTANDSDFGDILYFNLTTIPSGGFFSIDADGKITTSGLNYEAISSHKLQVVVSDKAGLSVDWNITVNVTDIQEPPSFINLPNSTSCIAEDLAIETMLFTINVFDPENDAIAYTLTSFNDNFLVNGTSGEVSLKSGASLNYELTNQYLLPIVANDGTLTATSTLTVAICNVNESPSIVNLPTTINLSKDVSGRKLLLTISVQDEDIGDSHTFAIVSTTPTNQLSNFTVDSSGGIYSEAINDFKSTTLKTISIKVIVQDASGLNDTKTLTINIVETIQPPTLTSDKKEVAVDEINANENAKVDISITCTDVNAADILTIWISAVFNGSQGYFNIDSKTGVLSFIKAIDYDDHTTPNYYKLEITCSDNGGLQSKIVIDISIIDHNDHAPKFPKKLYKTNLKENTVDGYKVLNFNVYDPDSVKYNVQSYKILNETASKYFEVDSEGFLITKHPIDAESIDSIDFLIEVVDGGGLTDTTDVSIQILDDNDHRPRLSSNFYNLEVNFRANYKDIIIIFKGSDGDRDEKGKNLTFKLLNDNENFVLRMDGTLEVRKLAYKHEKFTFDVIAIDNGVPPDVSISSKVRIDSYDARRHLTNFTINLDIDDFKKNYLDNFLRGLQKIFPDSIARAIYFGNKTKATGNASRRRKSITQQTVVSTLVVKGTTTEQETNIEEDKNFYTTNQVQAFTSKKGGQPSTNLTTGVLSSIPFDTVSNYENEPDIVENWWIETTLGRITLSVLCFVFVLFVIIICLTIYYFACKKKKTLKVASDSSNEPKSRKNGVAPRAENLFLYDFRYNKQKSKKLKKAKHSMDDPALLPGTPVPTPRTSRASARDVTLDDTFSLGYHSMSSSPQPSGLTQLDS